MSATAQVIERKIPTQLDQDAILRILHLNPRDPATQALLVTCERYELDPLLKHAVLIEGRLYVTRDGLLHVAHRSEQFDGMEVLEQSDTETHWVAKVSAYRKDMSHPFTYVGRFPKQRKRKTDQGWRTEEHPYGPEMAVKCAEVMALRRAFDVALAAQEEMWDRDDVGSTVEAGVPERDVREDGADGDRPTKRQRKKKPSAPEGTKAGGEPQPRGDELPSSEPDKTGDGRADSRGTEPADPPAAEDLWERAVELYGSKGEVASAYRKRFEVEGPIYEKDIPEEALRELVEAKA